MSRPDLTALVDAAVALRPTLDRVAFALHLAAVAPDRGDLVIADLALAFAAAHGDPSAVDELYALIDRSARPALAAARYAGAIADDAIQETSIRLLVAPAADVRSPLLDYQGRAQLAGWIRTIALRTAARLVKIKEDIGVSDVMSRELADTEDPARDVLRAELRPAVRAAFAAAATGLSYSDRELLAAVIVRGETIDELARRNGIHRATAARWVGRARAALDDGLRRELAGALDLAASEVSSVLEAIATSIDLTPARLVDGKRGARR